MDEGGDSGVMIAILIETARCAALIRIHGRRRHSKNWPTVIRRTASTDSCYGPSWPENIAYIVIDQTRRIIGDIGSPFSKNGPQRPDRFTILAVDRLPQRHKLAALYLERRNQLERRREAPKISCRMLLQVTALSATRWRWRSCWPDDTRA